MAARLIWSWLLTSAMLAAPVAFSGCQPSSAPGTEKVTIRNRTFTLELALDDAARENGLKHRQSIPDDGGMLFVFPDDQVKVQRFWMHNCLTDIDVVFLDSRGTITALHRMKAEPPKRDDETEEAYQQRLKGYTSAYPAQFAIELRPGTLEQLNLKVDEKIALDLKRLKGLAR